MNIKPTIYSLPQDYFRSSMSDVIRHPARLVVVPPSHILKRQAVYLSWSQRTIIASLAIDFDSKEYLLHHIQCLLKYPLSMTNYHPAVQVLQ
jgi:hypothetical protein